MSSPLIRLTLLAALSSATPYVWANDEEQDAHAGHQRPIAEENQAASPARSPQTRLQEIEELMTRIQASADTTARQRMLTEHLDAMRAQMRLIRGHQVTAKAKSGHDTLAAAEDVKSGQHASDHDAGKGGMMEGKKGMMMGMHKKVERRLEMLERMLQQLIEHEAVEREMESQ